MDIINLVTGELEKLKLRDIKLYDAVGTSFLADYFYVATSDSPTQMESARNNLIEVLGKESYRLHNPLEDWQGGWCLLDFGNIIIHILLEETRSFYDLESIFISAGFRLT